MGGNFVFTSVFLYPLSFVSGGLKGEGVGASPGENGRFIQTADHIEYNNDNRLQLHGLWKL